MTKNSPYTVLGIGGPILDIILKISEDYLSEAVPGTKGGMQAISADTMETLLKGSGSKPTISLGGSARNTLEGLSRFGQQCALLGMIGEDELGKEYEKLLRDHGIHPMLLKSHSPTARVLALITPDGERTMRTVQGASIEIRGSNLKPTFFEGMKLVHLEGYTLFNEDLTETAMHYAKKAGAKVSFDCASFEIVRRFKDKITYLLENYIDVFFANELESRALTGLAEEESCQFIADRAEVGVVLMGRRGCYAKRGTAQGFFPAYPVDPLDTTGAGDLFSSGFLHAYLMGYSLPICCHYGAIAGRAVVQVMGTKIPHPMWLEIFEEIKRSENLFRDIT